MGGCKVEFVEKPMSSEPDDQLADRQGRQTRAAEVLRSAPASTSRPNPAWSGSAPPGTLPPTNPTSWYGRASAK
jgi:hypothetical protein